MRAWNLRLVLLILLTASGGCQSLVKDNQGGGSLFGGRDRKKSESLEDSFDPLGARNTNRLLLDELSLAQIGTTLKARTTGVKKEDARREFDSGKRAYAEAIRLQKSAPEANEHQDQFTAAANHFRLAAAYWPDSELEEESLYFEGESFFFADRYVQSNRSFEKLVARYSGSRYLDLSAKRRFSIALYWLELAETDSAVSLNDPKRPRFSLGSEARRILHRIRLDDPTGKLADDATMALGKAFLDDKKYYDAADAFEDLRRNYPGSKHQFNAHMLELQARLMSYQGSSYDQTPLTKADALMKAIVRQFPEQANEELEYLEQQAGLIRNQLAERDFSLGEYYERRGENRAAQHYYEQVAENYQGTTFSDNIQSQITKVASLPALPKQRAKWLVDLLSEADDKEKTLVPDGGDTLIR